MSATDALSEMGDGNEYRQTGNGEHGIRAQAARGKAGWIRRVRGIGRTCYPPSDRAQDPVHEWRVARLARLGIPWPVGEAAAGQVDWHQMAALVQRGCPPWLALRILR
jgi:hypothetical protein